MTTIDVLTRLPTRLQRRVVSALMRDQARLIALFQDELVALFNHLGRRVARDWRRQTTRAVRQIDPGDAELVDSIIGSVRVNEWHNTNLAPAYRTAYLRTLTATSQTVGLTMGLAVNLPDIAGRRVVAEGGRRLGLVDIQGQARTSLFHALSEGRAQGMAREQLAAHIQGRIARGPWRSVQTRAMVIARTETAHAQRISALDTYRSMDVVTGSQAFDAQIGATDADCEDRDGRVFTFADADIETGLEHPMGTLSWAPYTGADGPERGRIGATPPAPADTDGGDAANS